MSDAPVPDVSASNELSPADPWVDHDAVRLPAGLRPQLVVVVDTEEEFPWDAPFSREHTSVTAIRGLEHLQDRLDRFGIRPTYVIDYPVATTPLSSQVIRGLREAGRCEVGAHLHPWVNPPFVEEVNSRNSFACNLGEAVERAKLQHLVTAIEDHVGIRPVVYKAGRYGIGRSTIRILPQLGFRIDTSLNPLMDYRSWGGPNFDAFDARPFVFQTTPRLLEVPCTHGFAGIARGAGRTLHRLADSPALRRLRMAGILARTRTLNKIMLSPETSTLDEMQQVTHALLADGVRTFTLTFHSPSVEPGHTPYVRSQADLRTFYDRLEGYCDFFLGRLGGVPSTLSRFGSSLVSAEASA